jgi:HEAT repeat protein
MGILEGLFGKPNIAKMIKQRDTEGLINVFQKGNLLMQRRAAEGLWQLKDLKGIKAVLQQIVQTKDEYIREFVRKNLEQISDFSDHELLMEALKVKDEKIRKAVLTTISGLPMNQAEKCFFAALNDRDLWGKWDVVHELIRLKDKIHFETLISLMKDTDPMIRNMAILAIGELKDNQVVDVLILALNDSYEVVRINAVEAIGKLKDNRVIDALISALNDSYEVVREKAADGLAMTEDIRAVEALITLFRDDKELSVRKAALFALAKFKDRDSTAMKTLTTSLKNKDPEIRKSAARALGDSALRFLINNIKGSDRPARERALDLLSQISDSKGLLSSLMDEKLDAEARAGIISALGGLGAKSAVETLISFLCDENSLIRRACAIALGEIADGKAVEPLIEALKDNEIGGSCAVALGKIGDRRAVEPLIKLLKDRKSGVLESAIEALAKIGDSRAREPIQDICSHDPTKWIETKLDDGFPYEIEHYPIREAAEKALRQIK